MSHDALFQLGMGSVLLNASQTEEIFAARKLNPRDKAVDRDSPSQHGARAPSIRLRRQIMRRGNSAKALALRGQPVALRPVG